MPRDDKVTRAVIDRFVRARLLTTGRDPASGREIVQVGHEALIREWDTLKEWVNEDREFLRTAGRVRVSMRAWEQHGRESDWLLPPGRPLEEARDLHERRRADLDDEISRFVEASLEADKQQERKEQQEREEQQRRQLAAANERAEAARLLAEERAQRAEMAKKLAEEESER